MKRAGLARPTPEQVARWQAKARTPLARGKPPARRGRRARREEAAWQQARAAVLARSGRCCEGPPLPAVHPTGPHPADHVHHCRKRSLGGGHDPANLLAVCWGLHAWIHDSSPHADGELRHALGLLVRR